METVTLGQAIRNAIAVEKGAKKFYDRLASSSKEPEVQAFFENMAAQEQEHANWISDVADRLDAGELPQRPDSKVHGVERAPGWCDVEDIQLSEAVSLALEAENSAALYYDAMSDMTEGVTRDLFLKLTKIEEQHAQALIAFRDERLSDDS